MKFVASLVRGAVAAALVVACAASPPAPAAETSTAAPVTEGPATQPTPTAAAPPSPTAATAPTPTAAGPPTRTAAAPQPAGTAIEEALAHVTPGADTLFFTDWASLRRRLGIEHVTGATPADEKYAALRSGFVGDAAEGMPPSEATFGGFAFAYLQVHHATWGFDAMDLEWEMSIGHAGDPPLWALRFRDGVDLATVAARFDEHGFATDSLAHGTLRSIPLPDWLRSASFGTTELAMANTGFLDDGRTLILGGAQDGGSVREVLANGLPRAAGPAAEAAARLLEDPYTAAIIVGSDQCTGYDPSVLAEKGVRDTVRELVGRAGPLSPYEVLAIGYTRDRSPIGRIVLGYADALAADAALGGRRLLAEEGISLMAGGRPYSEVAFTLEASRVEDAAIVLDVAPQSDAPTRLTQLLQRRDLLFAHCSS